MELFYLASPSAQFGLACDSLPPEREVPGKVRLIKDCLKVGSYRDVNGREISVSPETLQELSDNFRAMREANHAVPLSWTHGDDKGIDPRNIIDDITDVWVSNDTLWCAAYVAPEVKTDLTSKTRRVSVGVVKDWTDGTKRHWPGRALNHVAIVSHPAMPDQKPFFQLASPMPDTAEETSGFTFKVALAAFNRLLDVIKPGTQLPTEGPNAVTEENFDQSISVALDVLLGPEEEEPEEENSEMPVLNDEQVAALANLPETITALSSELTNVKALVVELAGQKEAAKVSAFTEKVEACLQAGVPAKCKEFLLTQGKLNGYDLAYLDNFCEVKGIQLGSKTDGFVDPAEPEVDGFSKEDMDRAAALLGNK